MNNEITGKNKKIAIIAFIGIIVVALVVVVVLLVRSGGLEEKVDKNSESDNSNVNIDSGAVNIDNDDNSNTGNITETEYYNYVDKKNSSYEYTPEVTIPEDNELYNIGMKLWKFAYVTSHCASFEHESRGTKDYGFKLLNYKDVARYFTDDYKKVVFGKEYDFAYGIREVDGEYYDPSLCGRGTNSAYLKKESLSSMKVDGNLITFEDKSLYCDLAPDRSCIENSEKWSQKGVDFIIEKVDGFWKVKYFVLPD